MVVIFSWAMTHMPLDDLVVFCPVAQSCRCEIKYRHDVGHSETCSSWFYDQNKPIDTREVHLNFLTRSLISDNNPSDSSQRIGRNLSPCSKQGSHDHFPINKVIAVSLEKSLVLRGNQISKHTRNNQERNSFLHQLSSNSAKWITFDRN